MLKENVLRSEIGTNSVRMSAFEDLLDRTLRAVAGLWGKFHYVSALRGDSGRYEHWGFVRTHGELSAQAAFAQAHSALFSQILRAPLAELLEDIELAANKMSISTDEFISGIRKAKQQMVPQNLAGGTQAHFNSVLEALSLLYSARKNLVRRAA
jgi:hypothetical protein